MAKEIPLASEIISYVKQEKQKYEDASQEIRNTIKKCRQNYANKFLNPKTSKGREKVFVPLTRWEVDTTTSKVFVSDKAVSVLPENEQSTRSAFIAEKVLKHQINETNFPMHMKNSTYDLMVDGTIVYALYWDFLRETPNDTSSTLSKLARKILRKPKAKTSPNILKDQVGFQQIDILNCWIDPTADSIQDAPSFITRNIIQLDEALRNPNYKNTESIKGFTTSRPDTYNSDSTNIWELGKQTIQYQVPMTAIYQRWGRVPLHFITGKKKDRLSNITVPAVIEIADLDNTPTLLRVEKNPFDHQQIPFVECWAQKKKGRWYGIGAAEKVTDLQKYMNRTMNRKIENEDVLHAGLFLKKRGSGISAQSINATPGGIIEVDDMGDLQQLNIRDISQLANSSIDMIYNMIERINGTNEISTGTAADRSATTSLIKDRNSDTRFAAIRGYLNDFLKRFFKQWVQLNRQFIDREFVIRVTGEDPELERIDEVLDIGEAERQKLPKFRFIKVDPKTIKGDYDLEVDIDQSVPQNKAEMSERILRLIELTMQMQATPEYISNLVNHYAEQLGLRGAKYKLELQPPQQLPEPTSAQPAPSELGQFLTANQPTAQQTSAIPRNVAGL